MRWRALVVLMGFSSGIALAAEKLYQPDLPDFVAIAPDNNAVIMMPATEAASPTPTKLLTIQSADGLQQTNPTDHYAFVSNTLLAKCPAATNQLIRDGDERGYPFALYVVTCPASNTRKTEVHLTKAIQGKVRFYQVQITFRYAPDKAELANWARYLSQTYVCDTDTAPTPC